MTPKVFLRRYLSAKLERVFQPFAVSIASFISIFKTAYVCLCSASPYIMVLSDSISLSDSVCSTQTVHQGQGANLRMGFLFFNSGGDFHIAWGRVGTVPTPGVGGGAH